MKRTLTLILAFCALSLSLSAQSMYDALAFGADNYYGTARSMALGNAVTALGGDTGMIGINPAGSAVSNYSVVTFSPGIVNSSTNTTYTDAYGTSPVSNTSRNSATNFIVPNFGGIFRFGTDGRGGIKAFTFSVTGNMRNHHLSTSNISGVSNYTTMSGAFSSEASLANMDPYVFQNYSNPWNDSKYSWNTLSAYDANVISYFASKGYYMGLFEVGDGVLGGPLYQNSTITRTGQSFDLVLNFALNIQNNVFVGLNLGIPSQQYQYDQSFVEIPVDKEQFPIIFVEPEGEYIAYPESASYHYNQYERMTGIYAKLGIIWLPVKGLRVGGAIQSPTSYSTYESWQVSQATSFTDSYYSTSSTSPLGQNNYFYRSPWEFNLGVAYTFGNRGLLSVDYEMMDYSVMKFSNNSSYITDGSFQQANRIMNLFSGLSHNLRIGAEFIITQNLSARAGFSLRTNPVRYYNDNFGNVVDAAEYASNYEQFYTGMRSIIKSTMKYEPGFRKAFSLGLGYSSNGMFFADIAARYTMYPVENYAPYARYYIDVDSPNIGMQKNLLDVALTLGLRF